MKAYKNMRKSEGWHCYLCDGTRKRWKRINGKSLRKRDRQDAKKSARVESSHEEND